MTISQMHTNVKLQLDKSSALELPAFEPEEIDYWLNEAIRKFVKTRYSGVNPKSQSFEETQKRIDDLKPLITTIFLPLVSVGTQIPLVDILPNASFYVRNSYILNTDPAINSTWPDDYWFTISDMVQLSNDAASKVAPIECTYDKLEQRLADPFSEHIYHYGSARPLKISNENSVEFVTDGNYGVNYYYLTYLRKPEEVSSTTSTNCDLPEHTHDEIVKMAASMMLENVEQPRYQTHMNEVNTME